MKRHRVLRWSITVALGGFLFGFDTAVISGAEQDIQNVWGLNSFQHGLTVSVALIGTVIGALFPWQSINPDKMQVLSQSFFKCCFVSSCSHKIIMTEHQVRFDPGIEQTIHTFFKCEVIMEKSRQLIAQ